MVETKAYSTARTLGLKPGDVIVQVNGKAVSDVRQLASLVSQRARAWDFNGVEPGHPQYEERLAAWKAEVEARHPRAA